MRGLYKESHYMQKHVVWASSLSLGLEFRALNPEPLHTLSPKDSERQRPPNPSNKFQMPDLFPMTAFDLRLMNSDCRLLSFMPEILQELNQLWIPCPCLAT